MSTQSLDSYALKQAWEKAERDISLLRGAIQRTKGSEKVPASPSYALQVANKIADEKINFLREVVRRECLQRQGMKHSPNPSHNSVEKFIEDTNSSP